VDFTVYVPNDLGERLKQVTPKLNYSALFREAALSQLQRQDAVAKQSSKAEMYELGVEEADGRMYTAHLFGALLTPHNVVVEVYVTKDREVIVYEPVEKRLHRHVEPEGLRRWLDGGALSPEEYIDVMNALGVEPVIEIGRP
jgi:hypothetical protein